MDSLFRRLLARGACADRPSLFGGNLGGAATRGEEGLFVRESMEEHDDALFSWKNALLKPLFAMGQS
jgi:hypothetical protein